MSGASRARASSRIASESRSASVTGLLSAFSLTSVAPWKCAMIAAPALAAASVKTADGLSKIESAGGASRFSAVLSSVLLFVLALTRHNALL